MWVFVHRSPASCLSRGVTTLALRRIRVVGVVGLALAGRNAQVAVDC